MRMINDFVELHRPWRKLTLGTRQTHLQDDDSEFLMNCDSWMHPGRNVWWKHARIFNETEKLFYGSCGSQLCDIWFNIFWVKVHTHRIRLLEVFVMIEDRWAVPIITFFSMSLLWNVALIAIMIWHHLSCQKCHANVHLTLCKNGPHCFLPCFFQPMTSFSHCTDTQKR